MGSNVREAFKESEVGTNESSVITLSRAQFVRYRTRASSARGPERIDPGAREQLGLGGAGRPVGNL